MSATQSLWLQEQGHGRKYGQLLDLLARKDPRQQRAVNLFQPSPRDSRRKPLVLYGRHQDLEGAPSEGIVVLEFPTNKAAMAWYNSPSYREVREHRFTGADFRVALVEGVQ
jgi:uncharacterized protein (DUF1330 family)